MAKDDDKEKSVENYTNCKNYTKCSSNESQLLLLFKSGINLLTRFGKTNPINFDKNLNSISGSLSNKKAA